MKEMSDKYDPISPRCNCAYRSALDILSCWPNLLHLFAIFNFMLWGSYYRPKRSFGQGNIFTPVCHSVNGGEYLTRHAPPGPGRYPPDQAGTPPRPGTPPDQVHPTGTRQVHPTGPGTPHQTRQVHPPRPGRYTPTWDQAGTTPQDQAGTPPRTRYTPWPGRYTPWDQVHPPDQAGAPPQDRAGTPPLHPGPGRYPSPGTRHVHPQTRQVYPPPGTRQVHPPPEAADPGVRSTIGRYASYWNAFLFIEGSQQLHILIICGIYSITVTFFVNYS